MRQKAQYRVLAHVQSDEVPRVGNGEHSVRLSQAPECRPPPLNRGAGCGEVGEIAGLTPRLLQELGPRHECLPLARWSIDIKITFPIHDCSRSNMESPDQDGTGMFQCSSCQRSFTRMDHLARHVRSRKPRQIKFRDYDLTTC
jgi:hypothetical protein